MAQRVVVVGGVNADLKATSAAVPVPGTSNPGRTVVRAGGVGRNVAENLARLGADVALVSVAGDDPLGRWVLAATADAGVDVSAVRRTADLPTGTYTAVLAPGGELEVAVADMEAVESLGPDDLPADLLADAALLVLDGNLLPPALGHLLELAAVAGVPVVLDPVSVPKAARLAPTLGPPLRAVTPNRDELAALTGSTDLGSVERLHARGVELVWVRLGAEGSVLSGPDGTTSLPPVTGEVVDVTGAGDAMLAAFCHALLAGAAPVEAAAYGHAAAALTVASLDTVRRDLSPELIRSVP